MALWPAARVSSAGIRLSSLKAGLETAGDEAIAGAERPGVRIVEEIGDERPEPGPPRGRRQSAPGGAGDQNRGTRLRQSHGRDGRRRGNRG